MFFNELFKESGMSLKEFCDFFEIPYKTAVKWKNGERKCSDYLLKLMEYKLKNENLLKTVNSQISSKGGEH